MTLSRRGFLGVLAGALAAPIVVRSGLLMPVKAVIVPPVLVDLPFRIVGDGDGYSWHGNRLLLVRDGEYDVARHTIRAKPLPNVGAHFMWKAAFA